MLYLHEYVLADLVTRLTDLISIAACVSGLHLSCEYIYIMVLVTPGLTLKDRSKSPTDGHSVTESHCKYKQCFVDGDQGTQFSYAERETSVTRLRREIQLLFSVLSFVLLLCGFYFSTPFPPSQLFAKSSVLPSDHALFARYRVNGLFLSVSC